MPCISRFYGISIYVYYSDHAPPHVRVRYSGSRATLAIVSGEVIEGGVPPRAIRLVREWLARNEQLVGAAWEQARSGLVPNQVPPLD